MLESKFALMDILGKARTMFETSVASIRILLGGARTRTQLADTRAAPETRRAEAEAAEDYLIRHCGCGDEVAHRSFPEAGRPP